MVFNVFVISLDCLLDGLWTPTWLHFGRVLAPKLKPNWHQVAPKIYPKSKQKNDHPLDRQLVPTSPQLGPNLAQLGSNLAQLGLNLIPTGLCPTQFLWPALCSWPALCFLTALWPWTALWLWTASQTSHSNCDWTPQLPWNILGLLDSQST